MIGYALKNTNDKIIEILETAGLKNGIYLTDEEIKKETKKILFYSQQITSQNASSKETYLVFKIQELKKVYGGATNLLSQAHIILTVYSRKLQNFQLINDIENAIKNAENTRGFNVEFIAQDYNPDLKLYFIALEFKTMVKDDE